MEECSYCGNYYEKGEGFPESEWECCCNLECWINFVEEEN